MRSHFPPMSCLLAFEAAARRTSFASAATELNLTPSAVSHQIAKLEQLLDIRLFDRTPRSIELTEAGKEYLRRVAFALDLISVATDTMRNPVRNALNVHASPSFATLWLMPRLPDLAVALPSVALSLSSSVAPSDFTGDDVDIDVRYGTPNWPQLEVIPIFEERVLPLASPTFIEAHGIETPEDLLRVPLIQSTVNMVQWQEWFRARDIEQTPGRFQFRFERTFMALEAAAQGLGVACDSASIAAEYLQRGRLRRVFREDWCIRVQSHFLVFPPRNRHRPEVASFIQWVQRHSAQAERASDADRSSAFAANDGPPRRVA